VKYHDEPNGNQLKNQGNLKNDPGRMPLRHPEKQGSGMKRKPGKNSSIGAYGGRAADLRTPNMG
jgi:hypothetical protein